MSKYEEAVTNKWIADLARQWFLNLEGEELCDCGECVGCQLQAAVKGSPLRAVPARDTSLVYSQTEGEARARGVRADTLELCARELEYHADPCGWWRASSVDAIAVARLFRLAKDGHVTLEGEK